MLPVATWAETVAAITRSMHLGVSYDDPTATRAAIEEAHAAGFDHIILSIAPPYPQGVAHWVASEVLKP